MMRVCTLAVASLAAFASIEAFGAESLPTETFKLLPAQLAVEAAEAAVATCKSQGYNVSVTITDRTGNVKLSWMRPSSLRSP